MERDFQLWKIKVFVRSTTLKHIPMSNNVCEIFLMDTFYARICTSSEGLKFPLDLFILETKNHKVSDIYFSLFKMKC